MGLMLVVVLMFVLVLMLVVILVLLVDKTKGIPLIEDALAFSVISARNKMKISPYIFKYSVSLSMNLKTRGSQGYSIKECSIFTYSTGQEEIFFYQGNTKFEEQDLWRISNGHRRGSVGVQKGECL